MTDEEIAAMTIAELEDLSFRLFVELKNRWRKDAGLDDKDSDDGIPF